MKRKGGLRKYFLFSEPSSTHSCMMPMSEYKARRDACRPKILDRYEILGFISSGTYGRVYKAKSRSRCVLLLKCTRINQTGKLGGIQRALFRREDSKGFAIKKFKPDREGETHQYTGISQSACREIA